MGWDGMAEGLDWGKRTGKTDQIERLAIVMGIEGEKKSDKNPTMRRKTQFLSPPGRHHGVTYLMGAENQIS